NLYNIKAYKEKVILKNRRIYTHSRIVDVLSVDGFIRNLDTLLFFLRMKKAILILLFITCKIGIAQSFELIGNDTINYTDDLGKKQGKWIILNKDLHRAGYADDQKGE